MGRLLVKSGVDFGTEFAPAGARILEELKALVGNYDFDVTITSARNSDCVEAQSGEAFDLQTYNLSEVQKRRVVADLQVCLGPRFCTVLGGAGTMNEYIRVSRRPFSNYSIFDYLLSI